MHSIYLVTRRDYLGYVSAWGFWLGLLFTPILLGIFLLAPAFAASSQPARYFTIIETETDFSQALIKEMEKLQVQQARILIDPAASMQGQPSEKLEKFDQLILQGRSAEEAFTEAGGSPGLFQSNQSFHLIEPPATTAEALAPYLKGEKLADTDKGPQPLFAAIIVPSNQDSIEYWSENLQIRSLISLAQNAEANLQLDRKLAERGLDREILIQASEAKRKITQQMPRSTGETASSEVTLADRAPYIVSIMMAFSLWFLIFSVINYLLMGTIEERSNKIFDSLLTSVKLPDLLAGKLIAVLLLALTLMSFWGLLSTSVTYIVQDQIPTDITDAIGPIIATALDPLFLFPALTSFLLGYLIYGSLFLALGSLCDTIQEAQTLMAPLFVLLMAPLIMLVFAIEDANSPFIAIMAWVPLFTPFLYILRVPTEPPVWELFAQFGLMVVTTILIVILATRVYRAGAVHGANVSDVLGFFNKLFSGSGQNTGSNQTSEQNR